MSDGAASDQPVYLDEYTGKYRWLKKIDFTCNGFLPFTVVEAEKAFLFVALLLFGAWFGLQVPTPFEAHVRNITLPSRFEGGHAKLTEPMPKTSYLTSHVPIYFRINRRDKPKSTEFPNVMLQVAPDKSWAFTAEYKASDIDTRLVTIDSTKYSETEAVFHLSGPEAVMESYDSVLIGIYSRKAHYYVWQMFFRSIFVAIAIFCLKYSDNFGDVMPDPEVLAIGAKGVIAFQGSTVLLMLLPDNGVAFVLTAVLTDMFSLAVYNFWLFSLLRRWRASPGPWTIAAIVFNAIVGSFVLYDSIAESVTQYWHMNVWWNRPYIDRDRFIIGMYAVILFMAHGLRLWTKRGSGPTGVDMTGFIFFIALLCQIFDQMVCRVKVIPTTRLARPMRQFMEILTVFFVIFNPKNNWETELNNVEQLHVEGDDGEWAPVQFVDDESEKDSDDEDDEEEDDDEVKSAK